MQKVFVIPILSDIPEIVNPEQDSIEYIQNSPVNPSKNIEIMDYYETPISNEGIQLIAFSLIGAWEVFTHLYSIFGIAQLFIESGQKNSVIDLYRSAIGIRELAASIIQLALGVWLFLRPWQFQGWIEKFKPKVEEMENNP